MVPSGWFSGLIFLLLIAPGLTYALAAEGRRAGTDDSTFREVSRTVLASLLLSTAATLIVVGASELWNGWLLNPLDIFVRDRDLLQQRRRDVAFTLLLLGSTSCALALLANWVLRLSPGAGQIRQVSAWSRVFREIRPNDSLTVARVQLKNGRVYRGTVRDFTSDFELDHREIVLTQPLYVMAKGQSLQERVPPQWHAVILKGEDIETITVKFVADARPASASHSSGASSHVLTVLVSIALVLLFAPDFPLRRWLICAALVAAWLVHFKTTPLARRR